MIVMADTNTLETEQKRPEPYSPSPPNAKPIPGPSSLPTASDRVRAFQNSTLKFLSNASNETLGACAVGLAASTYLVLGRLGLVLIGAVGGIVLHANWEAQGGFGAGDGPDTAQEVARKRKELGVEVVKRVLDWRDTRLLTDPDTSNSFLEVDRNAVADVSKPLDYADFPQETRAALTNFTDAVIRDYVNWWYHPLLPTEQSFPAACRQTLTRFILTFSAHLTRKRTADPVLDFLANSTSIIIVFLNELGTALKASQRQDSAEAIRTYLQYQPDSNLANVISSDQQTRKLALVSDDILQTFLDRPSYNCAPVKEFLREILSGLILQPTVTMCSQPEYINSWIVYLLEEGEPELLNVIDEGVGDMTGTTKKDNETPTRATKHQRRVSRAEEAMEQAMREAEKMNAMIAEEEERRKRGMMTPEVDETASTTTTEPGEVTPNSSDSEPQRRSTRDSFIFDAEGNAIMPVTPSPAKEPVPNTAIDQSASPIQQTAIEVPTDLQPTVTEVVVAVPLTLHNAFITLIDLGDASDRVTFKKEPMDEYLIQIEPASSRFPGWMVPRKFSDFSKLHDTLRRLAPISRGASQFNIQYTDLPSWRGITPPSLRVALELYMRDALKYESLAESGAMKKFLDKETGIAKAPAQSKNVLVQGSAALENVGKNFVNVLGQGGKVLGQGGKGVATGGKAVLGGVQGVFGAVATGISGPKKPNLPARANLSQSRTGTLSSPPSRVSQDLPRSSGDDSDTARPSRPGRPVRMSSDYSQRSEVASRTGSPTRESQENWNLPPPPSSISEEYEPLPLMTAHTPMKETPPRSIVSSRPETPTESPSASRPSLPERPIKSRRQNAPINEEETRVTIDLIFAIITELYSLSSAWTIRLSLLSAAKTYLLRPQNPQLESIRVLLQDSVLDANFSDKGLAAHIQKLRENTMPTDEERAKWPKELTSDEREQLRVKARKLLVERGMPQTLTSVMGTAASGEALGRVFDCLQLPEIAQGLVFALLLQAVRAATQ